MSETSTVETPKTIPTMVIPPIEPRPSVPELRSAEPPAWLGKMLKWLFPVLALLFIALIAIPGFLQKWLWMRQLDYAGIFWTLFSFKVGLACVGFAVPLLFLWLNLRQVHRSGIALVESPGSRAAGFAGKPSPAGLKVDVLVRHVVARGRR